MNIFHHNGFAHGRYLTTILSLMNKGTFIPNRGFFSVSTPMGEAEIERAVEASAKTLAELKPLMGKIAPQLIG